MNTHAGVSGGTRNSPTGRGGYAEMRGGAGPHATDGASGEAAL